MAELPDRSVINILCLCALTKSYSVHSASAKQAKNDGKGARVDARALVPLLVAILLAQSAICDRRKQTSRSGDLAAETSADRVVREEVLRVLLPRVSGDVEVGVKQQRVTGRDRIGDHAERCWAAIAVLYRRALELLADRSGLLA